MQAGGKIFESFRLPEIKPSARHIYLCKAGDLMFAVITTETVNEKKKIRFLKRRKNFQRNFSLKAIEPLKMSAVELKLYIWESISETELEDRLRYASELLRRFGVGSVCFSEGCAVRGLLSGFGLQPMTDIKLIELKAAEMAARVSESRRNKAVFFSGVLTRDRERALLDICARYRYVAAEIADRERAHIYENMLTGLGISTIRPSKNGYIDEADAAVFLGEPVRKIYLPDSCPVISTEEAEKLCEKVSFRRYVGKADFQITNNRIDDIPPEYPRNIIISEALRLGKLTESDIFLKCAEVKTR